MAPAPTTPIRMNWQPRCVRYGLATPHTAATAAGEQALRDGGTAIDAALAAASVLTVVYPHMCAIGGDLVALVKTPDGEITCLNATGPAPRATDVEAVAARHNGTMPVTGPDTITVPGMVAGWAALAGRGARRPWAAMLAPAIAMARDGVAAASHLAAAIAAQCDDLAADPGLREVMLREPLRQPALAASLEAIATDGPKALYGGDVGKRLVDGLHTALTLDDLAAYAPEITAPISGTFRDDEILTSPPNTQGFVLLRMLDGLTQETALERYEAAAADRDAMLADPHGGDTIAIAAADEEGHAVSLIQSLYFSFGALILEPSTGIVCQNRGAAFTLDAGHPNRLAPGRRPHTH